MAWDQTNYKLLPEPMMTKTHKDMMMQKRHNSIANVVELRLICIEPSIGIARLCASSVKYNTLVSKISALRI